ncbi:hypothetical protein M422DRAFT_267405 [Sphaerobolus stellatus SS14]|uniref:DUF4100 domain-containing protein n=1 Tax=Sphaerobolus stellatus (strain SS14) TaxID=990650 RepID=A0A0C9TM37_SPHS4|nr:hypothetical protein M422DRAFT_267405 [Sphaerobolus stellatus SS14]
MPAPGSNRVPKTFDGSEDVIADFLELFENCAEDAQLPDKERTFEGYEELDWTKFKEAIEEAFEGAFKEKKYTRQSLIQFTRNTSTLPIQTDTELRAYQRGFQAITHYLIKEQIITKDEHDRYYCKAYKTTDVFRAGKYLFNVDAFDRNPPKGLALPDSESKSQGGPVEVITRTVTLPATPRSAPASHNMEDLLLRIKSLNVRDQEYAATYAKIQAASPVTADLLKQPYGTVNSAMTTTVISPCMFCKNPVNLHRTRQCPLVQEYLRLKKISLSMEGYWRWPNGDHISSHPQGIRFVIDQAEARTSATPGTATQAQVQSFVLTVDPIKNPVNMTSSFIEEIPDDSANTFVAQTARKASLSMSTPTGIPTPSTSVQPSEKKAPQYQYQSKIEDPKAAQAVFDKMLDNPITITQRELLAVSSDLHKHFVDRCKVNCIPVYLANIVPMESEQTATTLLTQATTPHTASIRELDVKIQGKHVEIGIYDPGQSSYASTMWQQGN